MELTQDQQKVKALLDAHPHLSRGIGDEDEMCTIATVNMALTGELTDDLHPCVSPIIHQWVRVTQDAMPEAIRDSNEWRECVPLIAGSVASDEIERARLERIMAWMWDALGDEAVLAAVPEDARPAWDYMLSERTAAATVTAVVAIRYAVAVAPAAARADAVAAAVAAAAATSYATAAAADAAADATRYAAVATRAADDYWGRRDPAGLLAELVAMR